jgi:hypothetical protein
MLKGFGWNDLITEKKYGRNFVWKMQCASYTSRCTMEGRQIWRSTGYCEETFFEEYPS